MYKRQDGVSLEDVKRDNLRLIKDVNPDGVMITPPGPFKNTKWYTEQKKFGFSLAKDIIPKAMRYEYVLYKPPSLWPELGYSLNGKSFRELLDECGRLRREVEILGFPTDVSDEHFLMLRAAGFKGKSGVIKFKEESIKDIVSSNYEWTNNICRKVNDYSKRLAMTNKLK